MGCLATISVSTARRFFQELFDQLNQDISTVFRYRLINEVSSFLEQNPQFADPLLETDFWPAVHIESRRFFIVNYRILGAILYVNAPTVTLEMFEALAELTDQMDRAEGFVKFMCAFVDNRHDHSHAPDAFDIFFSGPSTIYSVIKMFIAFLWSMKKRGR
jgi:hypothetical protein